MAGGPEWLDYLRTFIALVFVAGLILLLGLTLKKTGLNRRLTGNRSKARLQLTETLYLDPRRRLVLVRHDGDEHLLLLGAAGDLLVHSRKAGME